MSSVQGHSEISHHGFTDLFAFLRHAFQQNGLVSVPPQVLQQFKQYPLQDIDFPHIASFAALFEGTGSNNAYRLEANSFIYIVQIMFHLRPSMIQERVLHLLMVSVRLLKDEGDASNRLSGLAGKEIDRYAVARKRITISKKLIPWLLKHFGHKSTRPPLKIIAAQFLFHLLQGDKEAKTILSSAPKKERYSLGTTVGSSLHLPLRIFAADVLREMSLADVDWRMFWPADLVKVHGTPVPTGFMADTQWLAKVVKYLHRIDDRRPISGDSRADIHEILSVRTAPIAFPPASAPYTVTVSDRLSFILSAGQNRPLQIFEIPLFAGTRYYRTDDKSCGASLLGEVVGLKMQFPSSGCSMWNGVHCRVHQVYITFLTSSDLCNFSKAVDHSLKKISGVTMSPSAEKVHPENQNPKCRPQKQSCSMMIDFSQDVEASDDTPVSSPPNRITHKASADEGVKNSVPAELLVAPLSQTLDLVERGETHLEPRKPEDASYCNGSDQMRYRSDNREGTEVDSNPHVKANTDMIEIPHLSTRTSKDNEVEESPIAPAISQSQSQVCGVPTQATGERLPPILHSPEARAQHSAIASSNLQHLALEALHQSAKKSTASTVGKNRQCPPSEGDCIFPSGIQPDGLEKQCLPVSPVESNLVPGVCSNHKPTFQPVSTPTNKGQQQGHDKMLKKAPRRPPKLIAVGSGKTTVDWDEDLREDEDQGKKSPAGVPNAGLFREGKSSLKKSAVGRRSKKPSSPKKSTTKARAKKPQAEPAENSSTVLRSRKRTAKLPRNQILESAAPLRDSSHAPKDNKATQPLDKTALSPTISKNQAVDEEAQLDGEQTLAVPVTTSIEKLRRTPLESIAAAEVYGSPRELFPRSDKQPTHTKARHVKHDLSPGTSTVIDQQADKVENSAEIAGAAEELEVEVIHDSHPMDQEQCGNATRTARRSFGSALVDVMSANGMRPITEPRDAKVGRKSLLDEASTPDPSKKALRKSQNPEAFMGLFKNAHSGPRLTNMKGGGVASRQWKENEVPGSIECCRSEPAALHSQLCEKSADTKDATTKVTTSITRFERPDSIELPYTYSSEKQSVIARFRSPKRQNLSLDNDGIGQSPKPGSFKTKKVPASVENSATGSSIDKSRSTGLASERKRAALEDAEESPRVKRARKSDLNPSPRLNGSRTFRSRETDNATKTGAAGGMPSSELSTKVLNEVKDKKGFAAHADQKRTRKSESSNIHPIATLNTSSDEPGRDKALPKRQAESVNLCRRQQTNTLSSNGPLNHDMSSHGTRCDHNGSVPMETGKHKAFKRLNLLANPPLDPEKGLRHPSQLFLRKTRPKVQFTFFDSESNRVGPELVEEEVDCSTITTTRGRNDKRTLIHSKVDENGSPRLHLPGSPRRSPSKLRNLDNKGCESSEGNSETASKSETSDYDWLESNRSMDLRSKKKVSSHDIAATSLAADLKEIRNRPSIGVGKLLDRSFPQASQNIETKPFKAMCIRKIESSAKKSRQPTTSTEKLFRHTERFKKVDDAQGNTTLYTEDNPITAFDIGQLNGSFADRRSSSSKSDLVRRLRSSSAPLPAIEERGSNTSPPSFKTRLNRMSMLSHHMTEDLKGNSKPSTNIDLYRDREASTLLDAETTLVSGEAYEEAPYISPPAMPPRIQLSPSSASSSRNVPVNVASNGKQSHNWKLGVGPRLWNQNIGKTQQSVTELLEEISRKLLSRLSRAEEGIGSQIHYYRSGGRKILNNLVEEFDQRVTQEKKTPSLRIVQYRRQFEETIDQLQRERENTRIGPSLEKTQKSHDMRCSYIMANLEKFASAQLQEPSTELR